MGSHQLIGAFSKEFGFQLLALIPLTIIFFNKIYKNYAEKREKESIKNIELLIQWFNEYGLPKDKFISEQLIQKRFGFLIDYDIMEWVLMQRNPSSLFYHYRYTKNYIRFERNLLSFQCIGKWTVDKLRRRNRIETILSGSSIFLALTLALLALYSLHQKADYSLSAFFAMYSFAALIFVGSSIKSSLGIEGSLKLLEISQSDLSD